jgi:hypothetical protein
MGQQKTYRKKKVWKTKKEIIELERYKKKKILTKYAKLCAAEGIESSRIKRADPGTSESAAVPHAPRAHRPNPKVHRVPDSNPNTPQQEQKVQKPEPPKREKTRQRMHRTAKGQPVMAQQISLLLSKLEKR